MTGGIGLRQSASDHVDFTEELVGSVMLNNFRTSRINEGVDFDVSLIPAVHFHDDKAGRPVRVPVLGEDSTFLNEYNESFSWSPIAPNYHSALKLTTLVMDASYRSGETQLGTYNDVPFGTDQARTAGLFLRSGDILVAQDMFTGPRDRRDLEENRLFYRQTPRQRSYNRSSTSVTIDRPDESRLRLSLDDVVGIVQRPFHYLLNTDFLLNQDNTIDNWESRYFHFDENRFRAHQIYDARGVR